MNILSIYFGVYIYIILFYLWYRFLLRFIHDLLQHKSYSDYPARVTVIVPTYNEKDYLLEMCIERLIKAKGNNQIIAVDDSSTNDNLNTLRKIKKKYPSLIVVHSKIRRGKRLAQYFGLKYADGDIIVTVDSDSLVTENTLLELVKPFSDVRVGATTGQVRAMNREYNFLTKMVDSRYLNAFSFERASLSSFGIVTCCSGAISAYRRDLLEKIKEKYISQTFLGKECTYGDDRHLTNLIFKEKCKVQYVHKALVITEVPYTYKQLFKQQIRWKKSFIRESLVTFTYAFRHNKLLAFETSLNFTIPFLSLLARLIIIYSLFYFPMTLLPIALSIIVMALIRNMLLFFEEGAIAFYSIPYAFLHEIVIYWLYWIALFSLLDTKWGTR